MPEPEGTPVPRFAFLAGQLLIAFAGLLAGSGLAPLLKGFIFDVLLLSMYLAIVVHLRKGCSYLGTPVRVSPLAPLVLGFLGYAAASLLWSVSPDLTLDRAIVLAVGVTFYFLAACFPATAAKRLLAAAVATGTAAAAYGIGVYLASDGYFPFIRIRGTFTYENSFAAFLLMLAILCLAWSTGAAAHSGTRHGKLIKAVTIAAAGVMSAGMVLTVSRGTLYLVLPALALLFFLFPPPLRRRLAQHTLIVMLATLVLMAAVFFLQPAYRSAVAEGTATAPSAGVVLERMAAGPEDSSVQGRIFLWQTAWSMIKERPWLGYALGTFSEVFPAHQVSWRQFARDAHNQYLQFWAEVGLPGLLLFLALAAVLFFRYWRWRSYVEAADPGRAALAAGLATGLAALLAHMAVDIDWAMPVVKWTFWLYAGSLVALTEERQVQTFPAPGSLLARLGPRRLADGLALLFLAVFIIVARPYGGDVLLARGFAALERKDIDRAQAYVDAAGTINGWNSRTRNWQAQVRYLQWLRTGEDRYLEEAVQILAEATSRDPYNSDLQLELGRFLWLANRREEALAQFRRAVALFPYNPSHRYELARHLFEAGEMHAAERELRLVIENEEHFSVPFYDRVPALKELFADSRLLLALVMAEQGDPVTARDLVAEVLREDPSNGKAEALRRKLDTTLK